MKAQKTPKLTLKMPLYEVTAYTDDETNKTSIDVRRWFVRSIRRPRGSDKTATPVVNLVEHVVGLSIDKKGNYLPSITKYCKRRFAITAERLPHGIYTTLNMAFKYAIADVQESLEYYTPKLAAYGDREPCPVLLAEAEVYQKELKALKTRYTKYKNKQKADALALVSPKRVIK